jgi:hypothetical protein
MSRKISVSIDLMKIDKTHIFEGKKGAKYINVECWINDDQPDDQFGNNIGVKQSYKDGDSFKGHYIGNGKTVLTSSKSKIIFL